MASLIKICIAGKNNIAVDVLTYILERHIAAPAEVVVVCNRTETGRNSWQKSLRFFAGKFGVREVTLEEAYTLPEVLFLSLEFDRIVRPERFASPYLYNIHFSQLPAYKGMYTSVMPILQHEQTAGVTFHHIDAGIDTGDIVAQDVFPLTRDDTAQDLYAKYIAHGTALVKQQLARMQQEGKALPARPQPAVGSTYYSRQVLDFGDIRLDLNQTADHIAAQVRAFTFRVYQLPRVAGMSIRFCQILPERSQAKPGTVLRQTEDGLWLATVDYDVVLWRDRLVDVMTCAAAGDAQGLRQIPCWQEYMHDFEATQGRTPLMVAAEHGHYALARQLLEAGADISARDYDGNPLLVYAKRGYDITGDDRLLCHLRARGLAVTEQNYAGQSLQDICKEQGITQLERLVISCTGG